MVCPDAHPVCVIPGGRPASQSPHRIRGRRPLPPVEISIGGSADSSRKHIRCPVVQPGGESTREASEKASIASTRTHLLHFHQTGERDVVRLSVSSCRPCCRHSRGAPGACLHCRGGPVPRIPSDRETSRRRAPKALGRALHAKLPRRPPRLGPRDRCWPFNSVSCYPAKAGSGTLSSRSITLAPLVVD